MENQEIQRTIQFIINQQAQFTTDIQQLREVQKEQQGQIRQLADAVIAVTGLMGRVAKAQEEVARQQVESARRHDELEERFNSFVAFMEKYLSDRGDGHQKPS